MSILSEYIERLQAWKNVKFTENEVIDLCRYLSVFPESATIAGLDYFITGKDFFTVNSLLVRIREIMEQNRNFNPAAQWTLVRKQLKGDNFCSLKVIFDNVRTNLAIELMGGQRYLFETYSEEREPFIRKEFIEQYRKAVITPGMNWHDLNICFNPDRYTSFRKGTVYMIGYSIDQEIPEEEANRLFVNSVNNQQELLTGQNVLAIAQGV